MTGGCEGAGTYSFRCSACGACCNSPPRLSLRELFRHQRLFVGCLALSRVEIDRPGTHLSIAAQGFDYPSQARCPALGEDGRCTIHGDDKPATCSVVPLDPLAPDELQHAVLASRATGRDSLASGCIVEGERDGFSVVTRGAKLVEPSLRDALARRRADLTTDKRLWGNGVFEILSKELLSSAPAASPIPIDGFLSIPLAPALSVLAGASAASRERCLEYVEAQLALIGRTVRDALLRKRREDRPTTDQLRAWVKAYQALAKGLGSSRASGGAARDEPWRSEVEAWIGVRSPSPAVPPAANPTLDPEYPAELVTHAKRLRIAPRALHTYLQAGEGKRAPGVTRTLHATVKPGGAACNLACTYCYYLDKPQLLGRRAGRMDDATLEAFIADYVQSQDAEEIAFTWHGGEPTLLGLDFFRKVVSLQAKHAPPGRRISNDLQTNGTLLSEEWCAFLAENRFLVGLSVDGPRHLHDLYRRTRNATSSGEAVLAASRRLRRHCVRFGTLTTVNRVNAAMPLEVYRFLRDEMGSSSMQFIPCVEPVGFAEIAPGHHPAGSLPELGSAASRPGDAHSAVTSWSVDPDDWGRFLCAIFDEWAAKDVGRVKVNLFETMIAQADGRPALICTSSPFCGKNVAVEHDGRVYSCDHFVYPEHEIGRIGERSICEIVFSPAQLEFGLSKRNSLSRLCRECVHLRLCWGECPRTRLLRTGDGEPNLSYLCRGWKRFFNHAVPLIERLGHPQARRRTSGALGAS